MFQSTFNTLLGSVAGLRALTNLGGKKEKPIDDPEEPVELEEEIDEEEDLDDWAPEEEEVTPDQQATAKAYAELKADVRKQQAQKDAIKQRREMLYQEADEGPDLGAALRNKLKGGK